MAINNYFCLPHPPAVGSLLPGLLGLALGLALLPLDMARAVDPNSERMRYSDDYDEEYQKLLNNLTKNPRLTLPNDADRISDSFAGLDRDSNDFSYHKFDHHTRVRGWQVSPNTYFGQAKVMDKWGVGVVVEKEDYVFGINKRSGSLSTDNFTLSVGKRF
jgi:hypothetical protein